jgi:hypothetical protein
MNNKLFMIKKNKIWEKAIEETGLKHIPKLVRTLIENEPSKYEDTYLKSLEYSIHDDLALLIESINSHQNLPIIALNKKRKCFERRLHLVTFISDELLSVRNWSNRTIIPRSRINWKVLNLKWNKKNPFDAMTVPVMKAEYYRARKEDGIQQEYFNRKTFEIQSLSNQWQKPWNIPNDDRLAKALEALRKNEMNLIEEGGKSNGS